MKLSKLNINNYILNYENNPTIGLYFIFYLDMGF